jgi:acetylornithine deacetylase
VTVDPLARADRRRRYIAEAASRWHELLRSLVQTPSLFEHEHAIVEQVDRHVRALGASPQAVDHDPAVLRTLAGAQPPISEVGGRRSLIARFPGRSGGRSLIVNAHLDTVGAGDPDDWTHPPFAADVDPETRLLYGRGAMDDKAGVAISLAALEMLQAGAIVPPGDVVFHYVLEDETTGNGSLLCLDRGPRADAELILDGTRPDRAIDRHAGNVRFRLALRGRPASVSVAHMGVNAAEMLARLVLELRARLIRRNERRSPPWTRFPSPYQLVVQQLESRSADPLTVPERAAAGCYATFPPDWRLTDFRAFVAETVAEIAGELELPERPEIDWSDFATEPVESDAAELAAALSASARRVGLGPIDGGPSTGTAARRPIVDAGIPCLLYGPGGGASPHRPDERYPLDDLASMVELLGDLIESWGALPPSRQLRTPGGAHHR